MSSFIKKAWDLSVMHCIQTNDKTTLKKFKKVLTEDKAFATMYMLVNNLEQGANAEGKYDIDLFIQENRKLAKDLKLSKLKNININIEKLQEEYPILSDIDNILFKKVTPFNLSQISESVDRVKAHLTKIVEKKLKTYNIEKIEEQYSNLDETDQQFLLEFYKTPDSQKEALFENKKQSTISELTTQLNDCVDTEDRLCIFESIHKINNLKYDENTYIQDIVNMYELEKELRNNEDNRI